MTSEIDGICIRQPRSVACAYPIQSRLKKLEKNTPLEDGNRARLRGGFFGLLINQEVRIRTVPK